MEIMKTIVNGRTWWIVGGVTFASRQDAITYRNGL